MYTLTKQKNCRHLGKCFCFKSLPEKMLIDFRKREGRNINVREVNWFLLYVPQLGIKLEI